MSLARCCDPFLGLTLVANTIQCSGSLARALNKVMSNADDAPEYAGVRRGRNRKAEDKTQRRSQDADDNVSFSLLVTT